MEAVAGRVLVVDDNRDVIRAIQLLLRGHVGEVHAATHPAAAHRIARHWWSWWGHARHPATTTGHHGISGGQKCDLGARRLERFAGNLEQFKIDE